MLKRKVLIYIIILFMLSYSLCMIEQNFSGDCNDALRIVGSLDKARKLQELNFKAETLIAHIYPHSNFKGTPYSVLSGIPQKLRTDTISIEVGQATLTIVDMQNKWVYRFGPGEKISELKLNTKNWIAILGKFRYKKNCVVFFQRPNYSGYFDTSCLENNRWIEGKFFDRRYSSFTLPENESVNNVAIIGKNMEFQVFNFRSAFSGDLNYAYIFGNIPSTSAFIFTANTQLYEELIPERDAIIFREGKYFLVAGTSVYASLRGEATSAIISKERPFDYRHIDEITTGQARNIDLIPDNYSIFIYNDPDGFGEKIQVDYQAEGSYAINSNAKYIVFPTNGVHAVTLVNSKSREYHQKSEGRIPDSRNTEIIGIAIAPSVNDDKALLFSKPLFQGKEILAVEESVYGNEDPIRSFVIGYNIKLYMVSEDKSEIFTFDSGSVYTNFTPLRGYKAFYNLDNLLAYITPNNCVKLFNSCDDFGESQTICENDSQNFKNFKEIQRVKLIAFPFDSSKIFSVLIYKESTFDGQMVFTETTCLHHSPSADQKITIIPALQEKTVAYYDDSFYSGNRILLSPNEWTKVENPDNYSKQVSVAFGHKGYLKVIDIENKKINKIDYNIVKLNIHNKSLFLESGYGPVINYHNGALWTFDDDNYHEMRILYGGNFYAESAVSYNMQFMVFPDNNRIFRTILIDRRNSIIQIYDRQSGLVPIDHSTLGGVERLITLPEDFDGVILARYEDFGEYKSTMEISSVVKLGVGRHYSFVNSLKSDLKIYSWALLNNLKYRPEDAIVNYEAGSIEKSFTVGLKGLYGFVLGSANPINVLDDCIITYDDCENKTNIKRYCMRSRGIGTDYFAIPTINVKNINILITSNDRELGIQRKYAGIKIENMLIEETTCIETPNDFYKAKFVMNKEN